MKSLSHANKSDKSPAKVADSKVALPKVAPVAKVAQLTKVELPKVAMVASPAIAETSSAPVVASAPSAVAEPVEPVVVARVQTHKVAQVAPVASAPMLSTVDVVAAPTALVSELAIASIRLDGGTQSRASLSTTTIAEYAEAMTAGATFPPVVVFDDGKARWLADGFHRVNACLKLGRDRISCEVREGSQRDAILFGVAANATHGLRRSNADKRHAVELLLVDAQWSKKSDRWIADTCGVSNVFASKLRAELLTVNSSTEPREGKDGKARKLPVAKPTSVPPPAKPLSIAMAPTDEASALADLRSDIERHLLAWTWGIDPLLAVLESSVKRARIQFATRKAV